MKKTITTLVLGLGVLITTTAFVRYQSGIAGYTGSPGESTCSSCHGGGSSSASSISISAVPAFTNNEYQPGQNYTITVSLAASGFNLFGFGCEILNQSNSNSGSMHSAGPGVKFLNAGSRRNAVHTNAKSGTGAADFTFEWTAPQNGDAAQFYVAGNAVNGNNSSSLDAPIAAISLQLSAAAANEPTAVKDNTETLKRVAVYPNPSGALTQISYFLQDARTTEVELLEINGSSVRRFGQRAELPGLHTQTLDLHGIAPGIYFVRLTANGSKAVQQLISLQ